jgi:hypothetical protein
VSASGPYDPDAPGARFRPRRTASRGRVIAVMVIGPVLWVVALVVVAWVVDRRDAVEWALLVTVASLAIAGPVLGVLRALARREERRYADAR